jgi:hypothetical protein
MNKYTIYFSELKTFEVIKKTVLMFLTGKSGTVVYVIQEAGSASSPVSRRHYLDPTKTLDDHASAIASDLADNFVNRVSRAGALYTAATLEIE